MNFYEVRVYVVLVGFGVFILVEFVSVLEVLVLRIYDVFRSFEKKGFVIS